MRQEPSALPFLFDENVPVGVRRFLPVHDLHIFEGTLCHPQLENGELLKPAEMAAIDVMLTCALVVLGSNIWPIMRDLGATINEKVHAAAPGSYDFIEMLLSLKRGRNKDRPRSPEFAADLPRRALGRTPEALCRFLAVADRNACTLLVEVWTFKTFRLNPAAVGSPPATQHLKVPGRDMRLDGLAVMQLPVGSRVIINLMSASTGLIAASREPK